MGKITKEMDARNPLAVELNFAGLLRLNERGEAGDWPKGKNLVYRADEPGGCCRFSRRDSRTAVTAHV
jgi:hypothetical protein